jgi:hypothetical protein
MRVGTFNGFALRAGGGSFAIARRPFLQPLAVGESFTVNFDSNLLDAGRTVGISLADSNRVNRFTFFALGGSPSVFVISDGGGTNTNTGIAYTTNGLLPLTFTLVASNTYRFAAGTNAPITNTLAAVGPISALISSNASGGSSTDNTFYLGDMSILALVTTNEPVRAAAPSVIRYAAASTDGIPNTWWETYFPANSAVWVGANDPDGDGQSNAAEYAAGTSPVNASSVFAITSIVRTDSMVAITWSVVAGKIYAVESLASLTGASGWQAVGLPLIAPPDVVSLTTNAPMVDSETFLRVRLVPAAP